jgi:hypothetical protein
MATKNPRKKRYPPTSPQDCAAVTPADGADLPDGPCIAIWCGAAGDLNIDTLDGTTVLLKAALAGRWHWIAAKRIRSTNTTATFIVAGY